MADEVGADDAGVVCLFEVVAIVDWDLVDEVNVVVVVAAINLVRECGSDGIPLSMKMSLPANHGECQATHSSCDQPDLICTKGTVGRPLNQFTMLKPQLHKSGRIMSSIMNAGIPWSV